MKRSKLIALTLSGVLAVSSAAILAGCGGRSKAGADTTFTWYLTAGEDGYYSDYEDNPVIEYIMENMQFEGSDGEMKYIAFDFFQPTTTENARSEFNQKYMSGNWEDVIDPTMSRGITDMYEAGVVADLTPYITDRELMPNLNAYLDAHPEYRALMQTQTKDGAKYLSIPTFKDSISYESQNFGFNYRRDLLVTYGVQPDEFYDPMTDEAPTANPKAGQKFSGHYTVNLDGSERDDPMSQDTTLPEGANGQSWVDDVTFPSGHSDPVYISDWMWMFETYETAYEAMGIEPAYMMSLFYPGYNANGDLSSGFGGGGVLWYKDEDDNCQFGAAGTGFRAYLECMNDWYSRGWVCNTFNEDTSPFYQIDLDLVANGTVPLWMGGSNFGTAIQSSEQGYEAAAGAVVYLAATPINDIPGYDGNPSTSDYSTQATAEEAKEAVNGGSGSEYMLQIPTCLYQAEDFSQGFVISKAAAESKDMEALMRFFDFLYSEEGSVLTTLGLNAEQAEGSRYYEDYGLTNGAYTVNSDGTYTFDQILEQNVGEIRGAMVASRIPGIRCESKITYTYPEPYINGRQQWLKYKATGFIGGILNGQRTAEETDVIETVKAAVEQNYLYKEVYKFIKGERSLENAEWTSFARDVMNYSYTGVSVSDATAAYQAEFDRLYRS